MELESTTVPTDEAARLRVIDALCELLPQTLRRELPPLSAETRLTDLAIGSADTLALVLRIEDTLEIQVDIEDFEDSDMETIGRLGTYIAGHSLAD
jgi:acyl carrier protein